MKRLSWSSSSAVLCLLFVLNLQSALSSTTKLAGATTFGIDTQGFNWDVIPRKRVKDKFQSATDAQARNDRPLKNVSPLAYGRTLRKRMFRFSLENRLHLVRRDLLGTIVPVSLAAPALERFFRVVWEQATTVWIFTPPVKRIVLTMGKFELSLVSTNEDIPWAILAGMAETLLERTQAQFTNTFSEFWQTEDQSTSLSIVFRILPTPAELPGT